MLPKSSNLLTQCVIYNYQTASLLMHTPLHPPKGRRASPSLDGRRLDGMGVGGG